jgi:SAM-dependent methyltransferase
VYPFDRQAFDLAISRFGAMFFGDPVAAFRNIGRALRPGGRLALLSWREVGKNEWLLAIREALAAGRTLPRGPSWRYKCHTRHESPA